jgi:hypothetical protein
MIIMKICFNIVFFTIADNVLWLCDGGAIEVQNFNFAQKFNRRTTVELCNFAPLLQNPCYLLLCFFSVFILISKMKSLS